MTHPHHTLFCVLALANANRDTELLHQGKSTSKRGSKLSKTQTENSGDQEVSCLCHSCSSMVDRSVQGPFFYYFFTTTVELWSLELACLEHQGSLELVRRSRQFPCTFSVKIHPRLEQLWLELKARSAGRFFM